MSKAVVHYNETFYGRTITTIVDGGYGYVMVTVMKDNPDIAVIHDLVVHESRRKKGLGTKLLKLACKAAEELGTDFIMLSTVPETWLELWYKRNGFEGIGHKETIFGVEHTVLRKEVKK